MNKTELKRARERFREQSKAIREATAKSLVREAPVDQEERIKHLLRPENYNAFFNYYFGIHSDIPLADAPCASFHQSSYEKVFADPFIRQFRRWFRGAAKSIHTNVGNILHLKENQKIFFAILIGRNGDAAKLLLGDLQTHLESNERIIKDFGKQVSYGDWADGEFQTTDGKFFKALGLNQPFRGLRYGQYRPDFASVDDCESRQDALNPKLIRKYGEKITGDLAKAFHLHRGRLIVPNNYIVRDGLNDFLVDKFKDSPHFDMSTVNLRTDKGLPSWPERYTPEMVNKIDQDTDYFTSQREDYNNPIEEGKLFKKEWIRYKKLPRNLKDLVTLVGFWDLSYKAEGDYKAFVEIGVIGEQLWVMDVFCRKCEITEAISWHFIRAKKRAKQGLSALEYYDATAAQQAVFEPILVKAATEHKFFSFPMADHAPGIDKHLRIEATLTNVLFNGILVFSDHLKDTPDMRAAEDQLLAFEKGTKANDDFPDALESGVRKAQLYSSGMSTSWGKPLIAQRTVKGF